MPSTTRESATGQLAWVFTVTMQPIEWPTKEMWPNR